MPITSTPEVAAIMMAVRVIALMIDMVSSGVLSGVVVTNKS